MPKRGKTSSSPWPGPRHTRRQAWMAAEPEYVKDAARAPRYSQGRWVRRRTAAAIVI
mgnify:CR=1 FL=1